MAYLFVHFTGEHPTGEQVYFSISKDGFFWKDLGEGPVLISDVGENGVRDPFIVKNCLDGYYYILATDLRIANGKGWEVAQFAGSTKLVVWKSKDLCEWSEAELIDFPYIREIGGTCLWAPETYFDEKKQKYMIYWASMIDHKQRIFAAWTKDFYHYEDFRCLIEKESHVIDTTCACEDEKYYRFSADGVVKGITMEEGSSLDADDFSYRGEQPMAGLKHVEGPIIQYLSGNDPEQDSGKWCLYVDDIGNGGGYVPNLANKLSDGIFTRVPEEQYDLGKRRKRHGSMIWISDAEYQDLADKFGFFE